MACLLIYMRSATCIYFTEGGCIILLIAEASGTHATCGFLFTNKKHSLWLAGFASQRECSVPVKCYALPFGILFVEAHHMPGPDIHPRFPVLLPPQPRFPPLAPLQPDIFDSQFGAFLNDGLTHLRRHNKVDRIRFHGNVRQWRIAFSPRTGTQPGIYRKHRVSDFLSALENFIAELSTLSVCSPPRPDFSNPNLLNLIYCIHIKKLFV